MKNSLLNKLQKFGDAVTDYIFLMPIGALLYGVGIILGNQNIPVLSEIEIISILSTLLKQIGNFILNNTAIIFACAISGKMCDGDNKATGASIISYFVFNLTINAVLKIDNTMVNENPALYTSVFGINTLSTGVFGGIICALITVFTYKKFRNKKLSAYLSLFEKRNLVIIMSMVLCAVVALPICYIWPLIQKVLDKLTYFIVESDSIISPFIYLLMIRYLIPVGLSSIVFVPINYQLGTYVSKTGEIIHGTVPMFIAQLADGVTPVYSRFLSGLYMLPAFTFGMALAIVSTTKAEQKKKLLGMYTPGLISTAVTGISDPIEYSFMYKNLPLYYMHATFVASGALITNIFKIYTGTSFCGGLIDYIFYGVMYQGTRWYLLIPLNLVIGILYYLLCKTIIIKRNIELFKEDY